MFDSQSLNFEFFATNLIKRLILYDEVDKLPRIICIAIQGELILVSYENLSKVYLKSSVET